MLEFEKLINLDGFAMRCSIAGRFTRLVKKVYGQVTVEGFESADGFAEGVYLRELAI